LLITLIPAETTQKFIGETHNNHEKMKTQKKLTLKCVKT